jgi:tetratricopeptide (TPR) repeat protein
VNNYLVLILVGLFYILVVGGVSLSRREGLSTRFAIEALVITALAVLLGLVTGASVGPVLLFLLLYLITMRARWLTDLANALFSRRGYSAAESVYRFALRLFPDPSGRFIVLVNWGIARLGSDDPQGAIGTFKGVLETAEKQGGLGPKYEAACRYNLGVAYSQTGDDVQAVRQFNTVADEFTDTIYGRAAEAALEKRRTARSRGSRP